LHLVSLKERGIGVQVIELKIEEGEIDVAVEAAFEGLGLGLKSERIEQDLGVWRTKYSGKRVAMATVLSCRSTVRRLRQLCPVRSCGPGIGRRIRARSYVLRVWLLWRETTPRMRILAASHGKSSAQPDGLAGARSPKSTRRLGQIDGVAAISMSEATRP